MVDCKLCSIPPIQATALYVYNIRKLVIAYGLIVGTHYLVVFALLVVVYQKLLLHIRRVRRQLGGWSCHPPPH